MEKIEFSSVIHNILNNANVGLWAVNIKEDGSKYMYADKTMCKLLGAAADTNPEKLFNFWYEHIADDQKEYVFSVFYKMIEGENCEVQYTYNHPEKGETYVRCGGVRNFEKTDCIHLEGCHQDITELHQSKLEFEKVQQQIKIEKDKNLRVINQDQESLKKIMELTDDFESIYDVEAETGSYSVYTKTGNYTEELIDNLGLSENYYKSNEINIPLAIHPDEQKLLKDHLNRDFFVNEIPKIKKIELDYRCMIQNKPVWYRMKIVQAGDWKKEKHVLVGIFNNEENYLREENIRIHKQDEEFYKRAILTNAYSYFKINVTQNKIISQIIETENGKPQDYSEKYGQNLPDYDTIIKTSAKRYVDQEYKRSYVLSLTTKNLINQFEAGNSMPEYVCRIHSSKLGWHYRKYVNYLSKDEMTGDILSMTVAYNITEEIEQKEEQKKRLEVINALCKDYTAIYYVDLKNDKLTPFIINERIKIDAGEQLKLSKNFTDMFNWYIQNIIHEDDRQAFFEGFFELCEKKKLKKNFSTFFRRKYNDEYLYTEIQCVKLSEGNKASDKFVMAFAEKDQAFRKELEIQEKLKQDLQIINTLASEYSTVFYVNLTDGKVIPYTSNDRIRKLIENLNFSKLNIKMCFDLFVNGFVYEPDRKRVIREGDIKSIIETLQNKKSCDLIFRIKGTDGPEYRQMRYVKVDKENEAPTAIALALADKDNEIINNFIKSQLLSEYTSIFYLDLETETIRTIKKPENFKLGQFYNANYKKIIQSLMPLILPEYKEIAKSIFTGKFFDENFINEDMCEITFQLDDEKKNWRRCEFQIIERKNDYPSVAIVYFKILDSTTAENYRLTQKITSQNIELEEKRLQLEETLDLAQSASRAKTTFLNNMSHDIRTPMNAIIGFTNLASKHVDNPEQIKEYLSKINQSSSHLLSLINDVLDMSRIESGKMSLNESNENIIQIIDALSDLVQSEVSSKGLELTVKKSNIKNPDVICDKLRLNQILLNIVSNSIKYTKKGGKININVTQKKNTKTDFATFEFVIKDTGIGMKEEFLKDIFDPFSREKSATVSGIQGTGLGMSITKKIVDMMNGKISVTSKEGQGSAFTVLLDFKCSDTQKTADIASTNKTFDFKGKRLLLVEDNAYNQEIAKEVLEDYGFVVELASDGDIAVETVSKAKAGYFDAILMDIQMPKMDGYEATKAIRKLKNKKLSQLPIIAMTANAFEEDKQKAYEAGMNGHISKPIIVDKMVEILSTIL